VAYDAPCDYKEEESFVRKRESAYKARIDLADPENKIPQAQRRAVPKDVHGYEAMFDTISSACISDRLTRCARTTRGRIRLRHRVGWVERVS